MVSARQNVSYEKCSGACRRLNHIITEVIENRRTRAFLFPTNSNSPEIDRLYDARLLHLLKKSIASNDEPGKRYDVYKIDYGCYVDLISTSRAPIGLLVGDEDGSFVDVPPDDYRSIRRAILRPEDSGLSGMVDISAQPRTSRSACPVAGGCRRVAG